MILAWDWRVSLSGLVLIQLGVGALGFIRQGIEAQWIVVQTLIILLCSLILALSTAQVTASPTSRQAGNWMLRLMVIILFYVSWRLFQFEVPIPLIEFDVSLLFTWLSLCALLMLALSDNPLFTASALILWFIPMHVVTAVLFPFTSLIVLFGTLELVLALCCSYLILVERLGEESERVIMTDMTFPVDDESLLLPSLAGSATSLLGSPSESTSRKLRAVSPFNDDRAFGPSRRGTSPEGATVPSSEQTAERTGEHPLIATLARGKRASRRPPPGGA